ncbi:hypothetical protein CC79DRAFT_194245 [Sarocladium strictum]
MDKRSQQSNRDTKMCRRVNNMTAEQVQKKRAIDRDNQRHLRAKNKALVRKLQDEVRQLSQKLADAESKIVLLEQELSGSVASRDRFPPPGPDTLLDQLPLDLGSGITLELTENNGAFSFNDISFTPGFFDDVNPIAPADEADWNIVPLHLPPTNRMDNFIIGTVKALRSQASLSSQQRADLNASTFPNVSSLVDQSSTSVTADPPSGKPLSTLVAAHMFQSPLTPLVERLAAMYHLSHLVRWLVCRNKQSYERMPDCLRPSLLQRTVPHPAWVDFILFPRARDEMIRQRDWDRFDEFREITAKSLSVNWPFTDSGAVVESEDGQLLTLNPIFEAHIRTGDNWTLGSEVLAAFPYMEDCTR